MSTQGRVSICSNAESCTNAGFTPCDLVPCCAGSSCPDHMSVTVAKPSPAAITITPTTCISAPAAPTLLTSPQVRVNWRTLKRCAKRPPCRCCCNMHVAHQVQLAFLLHLTEMPKQQLQQGLSHITHAVCNLAPLSRQEEEWKASLRSCRMAAESPHRPIMRAQEKQVAVQPAGATLQQNTGSRCAHFSIAHFSTLKCTFLAPCSPSAPAPAARARSRSCPSTCPCPGRPGLRAHPLGSSGQWRQPAAAPALYSTYRRASHDSVWPLLMQSLLVMYMSMITTYPPHAASHKGTASAPNPLAFCARCWWPQRCGVHSAAVGRTRDHQLRKEVCKA